MGVYCLLYFFCFVGGWGLLFVVFFLFCRGWVGVIVCCILFCFVGGWVLLFVVFFFVLLGVGGCLLYTSPSPRDLSTSRMPSSA